MAKVRRQQQTTTCHSDAHAEPAAQTLEERLRALQVRNALLEAQIEAQGAAAEAWEAEWYRRSALTNAELIDTTVGQASREAYWGKRVQFKALVIAKALAPYLVPHIVTVHCARHGGRACAGCRRLEADAAAPVALVLTQEAAVVLVDGTAADARTFVARSAGIPASCRAWGYEAVSKANIQDLIISGHYNSIATTEDVDATRRVLYTGHDIKANALYAMRAVVAANPKTNETVYLCDWAEAERDDILDVAVTREMKTAAKFFQPARPNDPRSIAKRLGEIYDDFSDNVTGIFGRERLHLLIDLGYHSVLCWRWEGESTLHKGTTEILVLGDSGQGKSETMMRLRDHYGRGERIDCKSATYAGLVGGLEEMSGRRFMYWGRIPQNDRGLVILDEVKGMAPELIAQMTDVRSSQLAIVTRVGGARRTAARVRYFWLSNPRAKLRVCEYSNGVTAVLDLLGMPEDVRRIDAAIIVSSGEVDQAYIDAKVMSGAAQRTPHTHSAELCRALLALTWSRTGTVLPLDIKKHIVAQSSALAAQYSSQIPLLEPADVRMKIARLSISLAARLGSFTDDWSGVRVERAHVDMVISFLREMYNAENFAFDRWSASQHDGASGDEMQRKFSQLVASMDYPREFVRAIADVQWITRELLYAAISSDADRCREVVAELLRMQYLRKSKNNYTKMPAMIAALRALQDDGVPEAIKAPEHLPAEQTALGDDDDWTNI